jgi:hypothetical protein
VQILKLLTYTNDSIVSHMHYPFSLFRWIKSSISMVISQNSGEQNVGSFHVNFNTWKYISAVFF